jgi:hypothetical protein
MNLRTRWCGAAVATVLLGSLLACGGDDDGSDSEPVADPTPTTEQAADTTEAPSATTTPPTPPTPGVTYPAIPQMAAPTLEPGPGEVVAVVLNVVTNGTVLEEDTLGFLSMRAVPNCVRDNCVVEGTRTLKTGDSLRLFCQMHGDEPMTNGNRGITTDDDNQWESDWWYGAIHNGRRGLYPQIWLYGPDGEAPDPDEGDLGLDTCSQTEYPQVQ